MGLSRKEITFDLSQEALRRHYPRKETAQDPQFFKQAYKDIQRFMDANGFDRRQYSPLLKQQKNDLRNCAVRATTASLPNLARTDSPLPA